MEWRRRIAGCRGGRGRVTENKQNTEQTIGIPIEDRSNDTDREDTNRWKGRMYEQPWRDGTPRGGIACQN